MRTVVVLVALVAMAMAAAPVEAKIEQLTRLHRQVAQQQGQLAQQQERLAQQGTLLHTLFSEDTQTKFHKRAMDEWAEVIAALLPLPAERPAAPSSVSTGRRPRPRRRPLTPNRASPGPLAPATFGARVVLVPPPPAPWRNAAAVAVDNTDPAAKDAPKCGTPGQPPCHTIRFGVSRAAPGATVTVQGGGAAYLGECGGVPGDVLSSASGIWIDGDSLTVEGAGGPVIIDCEGKGRAFRFNASSIAALTATPGTGATLRLAGLEVRNGNAPSAGGEDGNGGAVWASGGGTLWLEDCSFRGCAARQELPLSGGGAAGAAGAAGRGGAVCATGVQVRASRSDFVQCHAEGFGGGLSAWYAKKVVNLSAAIIDGCNFTATTCGKSGGGVSVNFSEDAAHVAVDVRQSRFTGSTTMPGEGTIYPAGGGIMVSFAKQTDYVTIAIDGCDFLDTVSGCQGGAVNLQFIGNSQTSAMSVSDSRFTNSTAGSATQMGCDGGGVFAGYFGTEVDGLNVDIEGCEFKGSAGGSAKVGIFGDKLTNAAVSVRDTLFMNSTGGGLMIATNAVSENVSFTVEGSDFCECSGAAAVFAAAGIYFQGPGTNMTARIVGSNFSNSTGGGFGGGLLVGFYGNDQSESTGVEIDHCVFTNTSSGGDAVGEGGGAFIEWSGSALKPSVRVRHSRFSHTVAMPADHGGGFGGGLFIAMGYGSLTKDAIVEIDGCEFTDCRASYAGGAVSISSEGGQAVNMTVVVRDTRVSASNATAIVVNFLTPTQSTSTTIQNTTFTNCSGGNAATGCLDGGGLGIQHKGPTTADATVLVNGSRFNNNDACQAGGGMAFFIFGSAKGVSVAVQHSDFVGNTAHGVAGGGGLSIALPQDVQENLGFVGSADSSRWKNQSSGTGIGGDDDDQHNPSFPYALPPDLNDPCSGCGAYPNGCTSCPEFKTPLGLGPIDPIQDVFRRWDTSNTFIICDSVFANNTSDFKGGALSIPSGGSGTIDTTTIESNNATNLFGGGAFIGGTVQLTIRNSTLRKNACAQRGCQIFSSSGASITFDRGSVVELGCGTAGSCSAGFSAAQSGNVTWASGSTLACPAGYQLLNSSAIGYSATLSSWKLEPPSIFPPGCNLGSVAREPNHKHHTPFTNSSCKVVTNNTNCPCYFSRNPFGGHNSAGFGRAVITPTMLVSTLSYACRACPLNQYNPTPPTLGAANIDNTSPVIGACQACPYGSNCAGGTMVATSGFWGSSTGPQLSAFRCPTGYCCDDEPCGSIDGCVGNRGGALCGECLPGFAQTIGSTACRATSQCGGDDAAWFVPVALLLAVLFALFARSSQLGAVDGWPLNAVQPMFYFYQMATLLPVGSTAADSVQAVIAGLFNMQVRSGGGGGFACPFPALTTLQAIELQYAVPAVVAALLATGFCIEMWRYRSLPKKAHRYSPVVLYQVSILKALTLAFSTVLSTTFQLLHCVDLRPTAGSWVLYRSATHECGAWQAPLYLLAAALLLSSALPLLAAAGIGSNARTAKLVKLALPPLVSQKMRAPYLHGCGHWEAAQALHRLVVVVVYTFANDVDSTISAVLQTLVCLIALVVHLSYRPFTKASGNRAQTALLLLLVVVALLNVPQAMMDTNAVVASPYATSLLHRLREAEAVLLLVPVAVVGAGLLALAWRDRRKHAQRATAVCRALARCPGAVARAVVRCPADAADEESPLNEPLLGTHQLVSNSRGLRLTNRPSQGDSDDG
jgi:hypothetical protein